MTITHDMDIKDIDVLETLAKNNSRDYNLRKLAEECSELTTILLQKLNKAEVVADDKIIDEMEDVNLRLKIAKKLFDREKLKARQRHKLSNWKKYILEGKYKEI